MENKLPFYMAYPVPLLYNDDRNARRDYDYMKSIYPDTAKRVLPYMEEECDRKKRPRESNPADASYGSTMPNCSITSFRPSWISWREKFPAASS